MTESQKCLLESIFTLSQSPTKKVIGLDEMVDILNNIDGPNNEPRLYPSDVLGFLKESGFTHTLKRLPYDKKQAIVYFLSELPFTWKEERPFVSEDGLPSLAITTLSKHGPIHVATYVDVAPKNSVSPEYSLIISSQVWKYGEWIEQVPPKSE